jgi:polyvinyl alcohol dehydrogenase (cytochrome)
MPALSHWSMVVLVGVVGCVPRVQAQAADPVAASRGATLFQTQCRSCHGETTAPGMPSRAVLAELAPETIVEALTDGAMRLQGETLALVDRIAIAESITGRKAVAQAAVMTGRCAGTVASGAPDSASWNGWGVDTGNTRFQPDTRLTAANVARLELKWAFGIPGATQSRSQPAIADGHLYLGSQSGAVYALDAATGCIHWEFQAEGGVRTAISVDPAIGTARRAIYFADAHATAYALDAADGTLIWSRRVDDHPAARATGAPALFAGRLYVPTSGVAEESTAARPEYGCCTFRGSVSALDAVTGEVLWKSYTMPEPAPRGTSSAGASLWGPAGGAIWSAPTIDAARGVLYVATGNGYADPPQPTSNAVLAFDLATGSLRWSKQMLPGDVWIMGCEPVPAAAGTARNPNCPEAVGPDHDIAASPILTRLADGRELLLVTQKSGLDYALDPARDGAMLWQYRWGKGSGIGGVWGAASDVSRGYFAVADLLGAHPGGLHAVDLATGARHWFAPPEAPVCAPGPLCSAAQSAAVTVIPGVVFAGSADGAVRAYATDRGTRLWSFDTNREFTSVNGVVAAGGSIDGPGPVVAGGMLYVTSGNGGMVGRPGKVLLAFHSTTTDQQ